MHDYIKIIASLLLASAIVGLLMPWFKRQKDFKGQHIFITGGSQGIGLSLAQLIMQRGANVTIVARTKSKLDEIVRQLDSSKEKQRLTGRIQAIAADVTSSQQVLLMTTSLSFLSCHQSFSRSAKRAHAFVKGSCTNKARRSSNVIMRLSEMNRR